MLLATGQISLVYNIATLITDKQLTKVCYHENVVYQTTSEDCIGSKNMLNFLNLVILCITKIMGFKLY